MHFHKEVTNCCCAFFENWENVFSVKFQVYKVYCFHWYLTDVYSNFHIKFSVLFFTIEQYSTRLTSYWWETSKLWWEKDSIRTISSMENGNLSPAVKFSFEKTNARRCSAAKRKFPHLKCIYSKFLQLLQFNNIVVHRLISSVPIHTLNVFIDWPQSFFFKWRENMRGHEMEAAQSGPKKLKTHKNFI